MPAPQKNAAGLVLVSCPPKHPHDHCGSHRAQAPVRLAAVSTLANVRTRNHPLGDVTQLSTHLTHGDIGWLAVLELIGVFGNLVRGEGFEPPTPAV